MKWEYGEQEELESAERGLFVISEGNFQYGNSTLSFYDPEDERVENEVFYRANGMKLGDVAQSMTIHDGEGWIVVNNSHVIFSIDLDTFRETGRIPNLTSPRYIEFIDDEKAYVSQLWDNRIYIINPRNYGITGYIEVPDMKMGNGSTEQMTRIGRYVYCTCWSYQNRIIKIDTETDRVVGSREVGLQPSCVARDRRGRLWVLTDGGYDGSPYGYETPAILCLDPENLEILRRFTLYDATSPRALQTDNGGERVYWLDDGVWRMEIDSEKLPSAPLISGEAERYFGLTVSPYNGDIYVSDALDYQQPGTVKRFSPEGEFMDEFYVGVNPGAFCWK